MKINNAKTPISRIKVVGKVDGFVDEMINRGAKEINSVANLYKKDVKIAQRGDSVLVNSGVITSSFNTKELKTGKDFFNHIFNNIRANGEVSSKGLSVLG